MSADPQSASPYGDLGFAGTVLVGYEGGEHSRDALALGALLARTTGAELVLAHVYVFHPFHRADDREVDELLRDAAEGDLADVPVPRGGPEPRLRAVPGRSVPEGLQRIAETLPADMLVIGPTRRGPIGRVMAGSVAMRVLEGAPCPVAIASRGFSRDTRRRELRTIGVGFDGTPESFAALAAAASLATRAHARLRAITALNPRSWTPVPEPLAALEMSDYYAWGRQRAIDAVHDAVAALPNPDAVARPVDGEEVAVLEEQSRSLDLLALGSRSYGPLHRLLLGSVSARLVRRAACPLLLLPRAALERPGHDPAGTRRASGIA